MVRRNQLRQAVTELEPKSAEFGGTIQAIANGERDGGDLLETSIRNRLRRILEPHADRARHQVRAAGKDEMARLEEVTGAWLRDDELAVELDRFINQTGRDIDQWFETHSSTIGRRMKSAEPAGTVSLGVEETFVGPVDGVNAAKAVAGSAHHTARVAKAIGNRDAIYSIGKSLGGVKFKPWGAVKAGGRVAKAAPILAAIGTAADAHALYKGHKSGKDRERARNDAIDFITQAAEIAETQILDGDGRDGPPIPALRERVAVLAEHRNAIEQENAEVRATLHAMETQIEGLSELIDIANELFPQERSTG